ncbi:hypothetical protein CHLNCDRAFT_136684 [Chlorella variabilis]|uniref:Uncharacterized protein n=1 Tax=Chlorella variabilis TaxID=554065 RepID=E1ZKU3_CHLVA|nr:hypothetical protein CHLNCDRAFT_136684 [Chlorella variabilis]EFN53550.1 hypothetical protein CHLNCDRAFT_136684 [Chlorella variabilis]|eukprot:XP_005845652.1 hypothetical protein CHLNCDRAFT_136684 [Chlorella variabilis]
MLAAHCPSAVLCLLLACTALTTAAAAGSSDAGSGRGSWRKPGFCGNMDCPEYTVWQKNFDFQVREYREAAWVAVNVSGVRYELAVKAALPLLSQYFWGANKEGLRLQETVPLVTHYRLDVHPHTGERRTYSVFWFIPYEYQAEPPEPSHPALWLYRSPANATMFVRMFGHHAREWRVPSGVLVASYNHPSKHHPHLPRRYHHSEVWMRGTFNKSAPPPPAR